MATLKAVRGTRDLLPPETELWNHVETVARGVFARYGFGEIRTPLFEVTELFARGVGEETDIVSKEMYTWEDGERFDQNKLRDAWVSLHIHETSMIQQESYIGPQGTAPKDHIIVLRQEATGDPYIELVEFRAKAHTGPSFSARMLLAAEEAKSKTKSSFIAKRLVVPKGSKYSYLTFANAGVIVEEISGDFFFSSQSLTLRPENTAGVVRAYIEHKLGDTGMLQKLFYIGPQFRRERPQRGRYRQFWQIGVEVIGPATSGSESAIRDAEVLEMLATLLDELGIKGWRLALNSVGSATDRPRYVEALRKALEPVKAQMCEDNQRRAETNPLRVLDSKEPADQEIINALPKIADYLDDASREHFEQVKAALDACGVPYTVEPRLVRGLDYYTRTTFEFTVPDGSGLGTQNALLGGGRYDGLSEMLGGPKAPGIGFAIGEDRLILTLQAQAGEAIATKLDAFIAPMGVGQNAAALALARELRTAGLSVEVGDGSFRLKKSFEMADKVARRIVIVGEDEVLTGVFTVKSFATGEQIKVSRSELSLILSAKA